VREDVWEQNAKLVPSARRAIVTREALYSGKRSGVLTGF
jgi:hypothetical protein